MGRLSRERPWPLALQTGRALCTLLASSPRCRHQPGPGWQLGWVLCWEHLPEQRVSLEVERVCMVISFYGRETGLLRGEGGLFWRSQWSWAGAQVFQGRGWAYGSHGGPGGRRGLSSLWLGPPCVCLPHSVWRWKKPVRFTAAPQSEGLGQGKTCCGFLFFSFQNRVLFLFCVTALLR